MGNNYRGHVWWYIASVFPISALLHHAVFYRPTCMLNPFGEDYYIEVIIKWLSNDPSLFLALLISIFLYILAGRVKLAHSAVVALVIAFLPLAIWIWDIPYTGRVICDLLHDGKTFMHTRYLYVAGAIAWAVLFAWLNVKTSRSVR